MKDSIDDILLTFFDHQEELKELYNEQISQLVSFVLEVLVSYNFSLLFQIKSFQSSYYTYLR